MMKVFALMMVMVLVLATAGAESLPEDCYILPTVVIGWDEVEENVFVIDCLDKEGNVWQFFNEGKEWAIGDLCDLVMWACSEEIEEHEIVDVVWTGYIEPQEVGRYIAAVYEME